MRDTIDMAREAGFCQATTTPPAAQRQWVGLTKDQRDDFALQCGSYETVCAIEAKLKEKNTWVGLTRWEIDAKLKENK